MERTESGPYSSGSCFPRRLSIAEKNLLKEIVHACENGDLQLKLLDRIQSAMIHGICESNAGFYWDFKEAAELKEIQESEEKSGQVRVVELQKIHPDGKDIVFMLLYLWDGDFAFLEVSTTAESLGGFNYESQHAS